MEADTSRGTTNCVLHQILFRTIKSRGWEGRSMQYPWGRS